MRSKRVKVMVVVSALFGWSLGATGAVSRAVPDEPDPAKPRIIAEFDGLIPGRVNTVALTFDLEPGWHVYWRGQNDTGFPIKATFSVTGGNSWGEPLWPAGERHVSPGEILDYVYEGDEATLLLPVLVPDSVEPGTDVKITAEAEWLVCREACIPGWGKAEASFRVLNPGETPKAGEDAERIRSARARLPKPWNAQNTEVGVRWEGIGTAEETLVIEAKGEGVTRIAFLPEDSGRVMLHALETGESKMGRLRLRFEPGEKPVIGVVRVERRGGEDGGKIKAGLYRIESVPVPVQQD